MVQASHWQTQWALSCLPPFPAPSGDTCAPFLTSASPITRHHQLRHQKLCCARSGMGCALGWNLAATRDTEVQ